MPFVDKLKAKLPDYAKDIRLNVDAVLNRSSLTPQAAAFAAGSGAIVDAIRNDPSLDATHAQAALTAGSRMGMNNVWYPSLVEMAGDPHLATLRPELRMNAYATHAGVDRQSFELYALAASVVGKCEFCVRSHYQLLEQTGLSTQQLRDVVRIAAVINAAAQVIAAEAAVSEAIAA